MKRPRNSPTPRASVKGEASRLDDPDMRALVEQLATDGYFDSEIADKVGVGRSTFCEKKQQDAGFAEMLKKARARGTDGEPEFPSLALFREVWKKCDGKRSKLMELFGVGWSKLQSWLAQEPRFVDIIAERDLPFLEQIDIAARIEALGAVEGKDNFPGWARRPDMWQIRWYLNTLGKKYGYGENPVLPETQDADIPRNVTEGVDIEAWIKQEMAARKAEGEEDGASE